MNIIEFDIRGQICPSTLLTALKAINDHSRQITDGTVKLAFKTDNRDSMGTIPESAANMGYKTTVTKKEGYYLVEIGSEE
ncbi:MAG: sulfurtransferase TusA family protein [Nitrospira bacterium HGW-Nitrospira-1]|nr:MAG: sulfurtransferase TusA family protein [Nitrospira bacterium HGW-Nitrospira-1]